MMIALRRKRADRRSDEGTTLIEMMVVMIVFSIILSIITASIVSMLHQQQKETGQVNDLDASRKIINVLDHSVRYANAITTPGTGTDGSFYVEWQTGNTGQQQTCTQWRYVPSSGRVQMRTWQPPLTGNATPTPSAWIAEGLGIGLVGTTPIFTLSSATSAAVASATKEEILVSFTATSGSPSSTTSNQLSFTAINSTSATAPTGTSAVCNQIGRP